MLGSSTWIGISCWGR